MYPRFWLTLLIVQASISTASAQESWPGFRGLDRAGVGSEVPGLDNQPTDALTRWKASVPGAGWSSPIVHSGKVIVTSSTTDSVAPDPRKGLYILDLQGKLQPGNRQWVVTALDTTSGKQLWRVPVFEGTAQGTIHIKNSYASETPCCDDKVIVACFGNRGIAGLDHTGKILWKHDLPVRKTEMGWGPAASPVLHNGVVYWAMDSEDESVLWALEATTGNTVWKKNRAEKSNWATPFVWTHPGGVEIVTPGKGKVRSYDTKGDLLWELGGMSMIAIPTPSAGVIDGKPILFVSSGYVMDIRKPVFAIKPGARGDITLKLGESSNGSIVWRNGQAGSYHPSPVLIGDRLHVLLDRGQMTSLDAATGKALVDKASVGKATHFTASPVMAGNRLVAVTEDAEVLVLDPAYPSRILARHAFGGMALATPAVSGGALYVRTRDQVVQLRAR